MGLERADSGPAPHADRPDVGQHGADRPDVGQHGVGQHGVGQHGVGQHGVGQHGVGQHGVGWDEGGPSAGQYTADQYRDQDLGAGFDQATASQPGSERGTRARVARLILEHGPVTAAGLSVRLGLTPAAVRRHLDNLLDDGMIEAREARYYGSRGRGRPARLFAITDAGRSAFEHAYDDLATSALRFLAETAGPAAIAEFARRKTADLELRYRPVIESAPPGERVRALAQALSADGYAASSGVAPRTAGGEQLCQHHCPVAHVAAEYPQLCEAETEAFGRLLGTPVQRLATIAHGDGVCTTHVTAPSLLRARKAGAAASTAHSPNPSTSTTAQSGGISA